ncbi:MULTISPECIES: DUF5700 domain-containing putative Zn-dependent protease [Clostridia]|uniref:DUF5700 domain-containing putative Zn-dependent protease n=1 Tax=Clostridia TaxID=186801 RepID=UPI000EA1B5A9|nr:MULTISPECIES: DUF5700 domain-containing putative Zn-dependent protease [Clostridia]NBJ68727.1 hypothetical protein [Roseburia sp. 1XD42-34]RKI80601.1 hypothetical protein D7V87_03450 [Clostridium sp. 1xD42-85]
MINLSVKLDTYLVDLLKAGKKEISKGDWSELCKKHNIQNLSEYPFFTETLFNEQEVKLISDTANYLSENLVESIRHISKYFPETPNNIDHELTVSLLPNGKTNFGPKNKLQLFSIFPGADAFETYLFLIHIYYHEISFLNYTKYCEECVTDPLTPEKLKYYILTLIQNEGIGNYAVLEDLIKFRDENPYYEYKYFTYAKQLRNETTVVQSMGLLRQIFNELNEHNFTKYKEKINLILKNKQLPIINLVGTHMAEAIVNEFGLESLKNVHKKRVNNFFDIYFKTEDPLKGRLLSDDLSNNYFKEIIKL